MHIKIVAIFLWIISCATFANESIDQEYSEKIKQAYKNQEIEKATRLLIDWADTGNSRAQFNLASNYEHGIGVNRDSVKAFELMKKAAEGGYSKAFFNLSAYYFSGFGTAVNIEKALTWRVRSANEGNPESIHLLFYSFYTGSGLAKQIDKHQAIKWIKEGVKLNDNLSIYSLGMLHYLGEAGYTKDYNKAKEYWITLSNKSATMHLAYIAEGFRNGTFGFSKDLERAKYWSNFDKIQLSNLEKKAGNSAIFPEDYLQKYKRELKIISKMFNQS